MKERYFVLVRWRSAKRDPQIMSVRPVTTWEILREFDGNPIEFDTHERACDVAREKSSEAIEAIVVQQVEP